MFLSHLLFFIVPKTRIQRLASEWPPDWSILSFSQSPFHDDRSLTLAFSGPILSIYFYFPFNKKKWNSVTAYDLWLDLLIGSDWLKWRHNGTLECMTAYLKPWTWTWLMTQLKWVNMWKKRKRERKKGLTHFKTWQKNRPWLCPKPYSVTHSSS